MNVLWSTVAHEFTPDGSLRDIYVFPSSVADWQQVLDFVIFPRKRGHVGVRG